jgi:glycosyltransferase involved in cell wall biosynthesis
MTRPRAAWLAQVLRARAARPWAAAEGRRAAAALAVPPPAPDLGLALVIPVHNDAAGAARLVAQARAMRLFGQIVVVDDGSDPPLELAPAPGQSLLRHDRPRGGGAARNAGLAAVRLPHVLFFDADDLLLPDLALLVADLARDSSPFDLCLFRHADSRAAAEGVRGQSDWDEVFWATAGLTETTLAEIPPAARPLLAQTANYPWNRIFRTGFLRDHGIGCAETPMHHDIPLHWLGLIHAERMLGSGRVCAWHEVRAEGTRITNRRGAERLALFDALGPVMTVADAAGPVWQGAVARFLPGLVDWARVRTDRASRAAFDAATRAFVAARVAPWRATLAATDPAALFPDPWPGAPDVEAAAGGAPIAAGRQAGLLDWIDRGGPVREPDLGLGLGPGPADGGLAVIYLARGAGRTYADLSAEIAALVHPGDHVVIVDDGSVDDTAQRIARFDAQVGWGAGVTTTTLIAPPLPQGTDPDPALGLDLARAHLAADPDAPARAIVLPAGCRITPGVLAQARAQTAGHDLVALPFRVWSLAEDRPVDPPGSAAAWAPRDGEPAAARLARIDPPVWGLVLACAILLALPPPRSGSEPRPDATRDMDQDLGRDLGRAAVRLARHPAVWLPQDGTGPGHLPDPTGLPGPRSSLTNR